MKFLTFFLSITICIQNLLFSDAELYEYDNTCGPGSLKEITQRPKDPSVLPNLEDRIDPFVLETKKISIDGFSGAFNPTLIKYQGRLLMAFRVRDAMSGSTSDMAVVWLDDDYNICSTPQIIDLPIHHPELRSLQQDPRLICVGERLFMIYSNDTTARLLKFTRRVFVTELHLVNGYFTADTPECVTRFPGENELRWEKNWVPFDYQGNLLFGYSLTPHRILHSVLGTGTCELAAETLSDIRWDWGVLRGGTPAYLDDGEYLAFFHSCKEMASQQSEGYTRRHYFMGAYTFSAAPPFQITQISKEPIVGHNFYNGQAYKTWRPLHVIFPGGYVADEKYIWLAYGRQDHELWIAKLDKHALRKSLVPVESLR